MKEQADYKKGAMAQEAGVEQKGREGKESAGKDSRGYCCSSISTGKDLLGLASAPGLDGNQKPNKTFTYHQSDAF